MHASCVCTSVCTLQLYGVFSFTESDAWTSACSSEFSDVFRVYWLMMSPLFNAWDVCQKAWWHFVVQWTVVRWPQRSGSHFFCNSSINFSGAFSLVLYFICINECLHVFILSFLYNICYVKRNGGGEGVQWTNTAHLWDVTPPQQLIIAWHVNTSVCCHLRKPQLSVNYTEV